VNQGMRDIREYIAENGPYDGAMGFSQGAVMLVALILEHQELHPFEPPLFQVAIFLSGSMYERETRLTRAGAKIKIPTAHVLGGRRDFQYDASVELRDACDKELRSDFEHGEGHTIPRKKELVLGMASTIRKSINRAIYKS
jgi:predicted esterase